MGDLTSLVNFHEMVVYFTDSRNHTFVMGWKNWNLAGPVHTAFKEDYVRNKGN